MFKLRDVAFALLFLLLAELAARTWIHDPSMPAGAVRSMTVHHLLDDVAGHRQKFLPLAGLSHRETWLCQEEKGSISFSSDRYGFHNADRFWDGPPDTVLIGDSFVQGYCVPEAEQLSAQLEPRAGKILNLGLKGTGPFSQLGILLEYALPQHPKRVLWFILANDILYDLERELHQPVLQDYRWSKLQGLKARQHEIDQLWLDKEADQPFLLPFSLKLPSALLRLYTKVFRPQPVRPLEYAMQDILISQKHIQLFAETLAYGQRQAKAQGVEVQFIFIPDSWVFAKAEGGEVRKTIARVKTALFNEGISLLDPTPEFDATNHPLGEYAALEGYYGHFTAEGFYRFARFVEAHQSSSFSKK